MALKIKVIDTSSDTTSKTLELDSNISFGQFIDKHLPQYEGSENVQIRVRKADGTKVDPDDNYALEEGDRVSVTPANVKGA